MESLKRFKVALEINCKILSWNPTSFQLNSIARKIAKGSTLCVNDIHVIVSKTCSDAVFGITEGIDNSDLSTLIAMAIKVANE